MLFHIAFLCISPSDKGPPLPPHPRLSVISPTQLEVSWDEPFTWDQFPVLNYTITVYSDSETAGGSPHTLYTGTKLSKLIKRDWWESISCPLLRFGVSASNEIGVSQDGNVSGGFPAGQPVGSIRPIITFVIVVQTHTCDNGPMCTTISFMYTFLALN